MEDPKQLALRALTGAFIDRDPSVAERDFATDYIQHNPAIPKPRYSNPTFGAASFPDIGRNGLVNTTGGEVSGFSTPIHAMPKQTV